MRTPNLDKQADIATEVATAALEAAIKAVRSVSDGERVGEDEILGVLIGLLRAAGRWASFTTGAEMDEGVHQALAHVLEQERATRLENPGETIQ
ncbi:hypothetical protein [Brevundimonas faecalis]|uniref:Uncharacterized protein n=1 Tax=Brevundimonas faecalis TaxID=947378 RepID=A0ABV2RAV3_9CAUL